MKNFSFFKLGLLAVVTAVISYAPSVQAATPNAKQTFAVEEIAANKCKCNKNRVIQENVQQVNGHCGCQKNKRRHHRHNNGCNHHRKSNDCGCSR